MLERKYLKELDWVLVAVYGLLVSWGLVAVASATRVDFADPATMGFLRRQSLWAVASTVMLVVALSVDYRHLQRHGRVWYGIMLALLVAVFLFGEDVGGARRWLSVGPLGVQPAEFAKILIILSLGALLAAKEGYWTHWSDLALPAAYVVPPLVLVALQPDLGTSAVFAALLFGMLFVAGVHLRWLGGLVAGGLAGIGGLVLLQTQLGITLLQEYQVRRLAAFLDPTLDMLGAGYHIIQSRLAIGSGRLFGQGLFQGGQTQLQFLPEQHTDFIFTVIGEEMGFIGASVLLGLYLVLLYRGLLAARDAQDLYGTLLATGVVTMFAFHIVVNVGMTLGMMPVTGLPLPFLSFGGSHLMASAVGVGLLLNVGMHRRKILF